MGNTRNTGHLRNLISYDSSGNIVLPANLTVTGSLLANGGGSYATQSYVTTQISNLVNAAPGALDTLNELATALGNDANFSTTVTNSIATKLALSGGTLTGALSGTSATFSGAINLTGTANSFQVASIFRNANRVFFGGDTGGYFFQNSANTTTVLQIADSGVTTFSSTVQANAKLFLQRASNGADTLIQFKNEVGADRAYIKFGGTTEELSFYSGAGGTRNMIIGSDGAMGFNYPTLGVRSFMFRALPDRPLAIEVAESGGIHSLYFRPNSSGRHLITSNYLSGGVYLPLALSGRENDSDLVLTNNGYVGIGTNNPLRTLHVMGQAAFDMTSTGVVIQSNGTVSEIVSYKQTGSTYADLHLRGANLGIVINGSNGKVGIGTASPSYNLSVASYLGVGAQGGGDIVLIGGGSGIGAFMQLRYADGNTNVHLAGNGNSYLNAYYGNTGVGTTNPASTLSVQGEIAKYCTTSGVDGYFQNLIKYGYASDLQSGNSNANRWLGIDATVTAGAAVTNTLRIRAYGGGSGNAAPVNVVDFRGDQSSVFYSYIRHNTRVFSGNSYVGNLSPNLNTAYSRNYLLVCDLNNAAGFSLSGHMNAASYTCWNMSSFWIMKNYSSTNGSAGITGMYKGGGCDMNIVDLNYAGGRYIAIGYTSNPEVNGMWIGYRVNHMLNADGSAIVVPDSSVSINSTYATY